MTQNIRVAVRVRQVHAHRQDQRNVLEINSRQIRIKNFETGHEAQFQLTPYYSSFNGSKEVPPANNNPLFDDIGKEALKSIYLGRSSTLLFYGESGSGKSYSIEGHQSKGFLQLLLSEIFQSKKKQNDGEGILTEVRISYVQIYNQKLRDLLSPRSSSFTSSKASMNACGVNPVICESSSEALELFEDGKKIRMIGSEVMNKNSRRSHTIFTIYYKQIRGSKVMESYLNIVELAGSQRYSKTETAARYQQANNINKSIINLGIVVDILANNSLKKLTDFVPFKNSLLTHMLSEGLDGTNKTFLIATISSEQSHYEQSLSTLKFAQKASAITLQRPNKLQQKAAQQKQQKSKQTEKKETEIQDYQNQLGKERERKTAMSQNRKNYFKHLGLLTDKQKGQSNFPCLINISDDSSVTGILTYALKAGQTKIGKSQLLQNDIKLDALGMQKRHCSVFCHEGKVFIEPRNGSKLFINGTVIAEKKQVHNFDRITFGLITFQLITSKQNQNVNPIEKYEQFTNDRLSANTNDMKVLLDNLEKRVSSSTFAKFLQNYKDLLSDVDEANEYSSLNYKKFPIKSRNIQYFVNIAEKFVNGEVLLIVCCQHQQTKQIKYIWTQQKFQARLSEMQIWYSDILGQTCQTNCEVSPWFQASHHYMKEKQKMQSMSKKQLFDFWARKQTINSEANKDFILRQKEILCKLSKIGASLELVEYYADYYFRDRQISSENIEKCKKLKEVGQTHGLVEKYVECCAQIQKCNMENKVCNDQKSKYKQRKHRDPKEKVKQKETDGELEVLMQENSWLNEKIEELTQQLRKKIKQNNDRAKNKE